MTTETAAETPVRYGWNQPICERDWFDQRSIRANDGTFIGVRMPVRVREPDIETCAWCGSPTIFGAYLRADPTSVPNPKPRDDS